VSIMTGVDIPARNVTNTTVYEGSSTYMKYVVYLSNSSCEASCADDCCLLLATRIKTTCSTCLAS
jgi:hypothetical protein